MKRKLFIYLFILGFCLYASGNRVSSSENAKAAGSHSQNSSENSNDLEKTLAMIRTLEEPAREAHGRLLNYLETTGQNYRKNYGGAYLDQEKNLTVWVVDPSEEVYALFREALSYSRILFKEGLYTLDSMEELNKRFISRIGENPNPAVTEAGIDEQNNYYSVQLKTNTPEEQKAFWEWLGLSETPMVHFSKGGEMSLLTLIHLH